MRLTLLDLCCGPGGATRGYQEAGFHVTGVDIKPQPNYCGDAFILADALEVPLDGYDAIHASPPCPRYANVTRWRGDPEGHPDLLGPIRQRLLSSGVPWVIENVPHAPMRVDFLLCGSMFGLKVKRHRLFETSWRGFGFALACHHADLLPFMHKGERAYADAMGCTWMTKFEARDAIPPAYSRYLGAFLLDQLEAAA
jgi:SAM-dependent methyltransferase